MQTYISMLRGINVSGQKLIKMDALRTLVESLGFHNVTTYIQSGNIIFQSEHLNTDSITLTIKSGIADFFGFDVQVMVLDTEYLKLVAEGNPFVNASTEDTSSLYVSFLSKQPSETLVEKIKSGNYGVDEFIISDKVIYLSCPKGHGNSKLSNNFFENKLKVTATTRNWRTVNELLSIANSI